MKKQLKKLRSFVRRFLGTEQQQVQLESQWEQLEKQWEQLEKQREQLEKQREQLGKQRQLLLEVLSLLKYSIIDPEKVNSSTTYKRCTEIVSLLSPMDVRGGAFVRIGRDYDGGYVMLDNFQMESIDVAYSFGIGNDVSWDEAIADRGIDVFMYDHTIDELPKDNPKFHFSKMGVTGHLKASNLETLGAFLSHNNHTMHKNMIMKMDIEGCEWDVFDEAPSETINQFSQIVLELHRLCLIREDREYLSIVNVLKKINQTHQSIHVHANTYGIPLWIGDKVLPNLLEVTYIRREDVKDDLVRNTRRFPTRIDKPTFKGLPDLDLGNFGGK